MRLIDADKLKEKMGTIEAWEYAPIDQHVIAVGDIDDAPTIDPVKHGRWIPCEERLPEEPFGCLVTVMDYNPMTCEEFENILPYFVGWDGEQWNDYDGEQCPFEVLAWMRLPEPYKMDEVSE